MRVSFLWIVCFVLTACQHAPGMVHSPAHQPAPTIERVQSTCMSFLGDLDAMTPKELKLENERWQKVPGERKPEDDVKASLVAGFYQAKIRNYERSVDILSPLTNKKNIDDGCKVSISMYIDLLTETAAMERDLVAEKKQKIELERKLKALSEIEKDISRRDTKSKGL
ncbi:MAG: hypothetical protein H7249_19300 [Chitinophagaceae bacterium]|nr:hypothetical protein [Oligoflexus sp.]